MECRKFGAARFEDCSDCNLFELMKKSHILSKLLDLIYLPNFEVQASELVHVRTFNKSSVGSTRHPPVSVQADISMTLNKCIAKTESQSRIGY